MNGPAGYVVLFVFALMLMTIGIQGNLGVFVAILFCPAYVTISDSGTDGVASPPTTTPPGRL